jgi:uroporphyrinogen-III synthase
LGAAAITVALTRPRGIDSALPEKLSAAGVRVLDCALTQVCPATADDIARARSLFASAQAVVLVSPQAVKAAIAHAAQALHGKLIAVMGPGSRAALAQSGVGASTIIESATQDGLGLVDRLAASLPSGAQIAIGRAQAGRDDLAQALRTHGFTVHFATLYVRVEAPWPSDLATALTHAAQQDLRILFTTSSAPAQFAARLAAAGEGRAQVLRNAIAVCTHPNVAQAARHVGFTRVFTHSGDEASWLASLQSSHE